MSLISCNIVHYVCGIVIKVESICGCLVAVSVNLSDLCCIAIVYAYIKVKLMSKDLASGSMFRHDVWDFPFRESFWSEISKVLLVSLVNMHRIWFVRQLANHSNY
jgi:hypothetical protein